MVGAALRDAGGDGADADLGDELHRDPGLGVDVLQVVDELRQVLDRVDIVVRGGGEIRPTPGVEWRTLAITASTLWPGSWPPSPGLAP